MGHLIHSLTRLTPLSHYTGHTLSPHLMRIVNGRFIQPPFLYVLLNEASFKAFSPSDIYM